MSDRIQYQFSRGEEAAQVVLACRDVAQNHSGSWGLGFHFAKTFMNEEVWRQYRGSDRNGDVAHRVLSPDNAYARGPFSEGEVIDFMPTLVEEGKTARGNTVLGIMGIAVYNDREYNALVHGWIFPNGRDRSYHGVAERSRQALLSAIQEGTPIKITLAKATGTLMGIYSGRNVTKNVVVLTPELVHSFSDGKLLYDLGDFPAIEDDRTKGMPDEVTPKAINASQAKMWANLTDDQRSVMMGDAISDTPEVEDILADVLAG